MSQLFEMYRPKDFEGLIGIDSAVKRIRAMIGRPDWDRDAIWIEGTSGSGKTTLANIIASTVCDCDFDIEHIKGTKCTIERVCDVERSWQLVSFGKSGFRVALVDEAQDMTAK